MSEKRFEEIENECREEARKEFGNIAALGNVALRRAVVRYMDERLEGEKNGNGKNKNTEQRSRKENGNSSTGPRG
jgi:hypothetical protein